MLLSLFAIVTSVFATSYEATVTKLQDAKCACTGEVRLLADNCAFGRFRFYLGDWTEMGPLEEMELLYEKTIHLGDADFAIFDHENLCPGEYTYSILMSISVDQQTGQPIWSKMKVQTIVIEGPDEYLDASLTVNQGGNCYGAGSASVAATGGTPAITYSWKKSGIPFASTSSVSGLLAGNYTVEVKDANGCTKNFSFTINAQSDPIDFDITKIDGGCNETQKGFAMITNITGASTPNRTIQWSPGGPTNTLGWTNMVPGNYSVTVTNTTTGCSKTKSFTIVDRPDFSFDADVVQSGCDGTPNSGSITLKDFTGVAPYTIVWNPNTLSGISATNLPPGTYTATVTDANGCVSVVTRTITNVPPVDFDLITKAVRISSTVCQGTVTVNNLVGTPPFTYNWIQPGGCTGTSCTATLPQQFRVIITDANGCSTEQEATLTSCPPKRINNVGPNPFSGSVSIEYALGYPASVNAKLLSLTLADVATFTIGSRSTGTHTDVCNFSSVPNGTYLLSLEVNGVQDQEAVIVVKY